MIADGLLLKRAHQISAFLARHNSQSICTPSTWPFPTWDNWFDSLRCWQTFQQSLHGLIPEDVGKPFHNSYNWFDSSRCWQTSRQSLLWLWLLQSPPFPGNAHLWGRVMVQGLRYWYCSKGTVLWFSLTPLMFVGKILQCPNIKTSWSIKMGDCELKNLKISTWPFVVSCLPIW